MKKIKIIIAALGLLMFANPSIIKAQNEIEALRYSQMYWGGTARFLGTGSSMGAVGADPSAISVNPASMGIYRKSDLSISPTIQYSKNLASHLGSEFAEDFKYNFNINNLGMVFTGQVGSNHSDRPQWKYIQFGMGINRLANYHSNSLIEGFNDRGSILDQYVDYANGYSPEYLGDFDTWLAYEAYLIDPIDTILNLYSGVIPNGGVQQRKIINTKGSMNEWYFALSGNYNDKLFVGATLGLPYFSYSEHSQHIEEDINDTIARFQSLSISDDLKTSGSGVNFKLGFLYRPIEYVRFGGAIHTPSFFYRINDRFSRTIQSNVDGLNRKQVSDVLDYRYEINTPLRLMGNFAFQYKTLGFIGIDYEYVDYSKTRMRASDFSFFNENNAIKDKYQSAHVIRVGGELNLSPMALRLGYNYYTNPFKSSVNDASRSSISAGLGFRSEVAYLDFAYIYTMAKEDFYLYSPNYIDASKMESIRSNFVLTLGFRF
ncbi:MAG: OmpP1/FadL family transporter [Bacteroidales bacterium]